ncbi:MAG TPA: Uma2 family endonuclease [Acetobacteraceae bacterium]|nr:Uma2 family endonuclease [Acetobacteraceae bacterium]
MVGMSALAKRPVRMRVQDFLGWEPGDHCRYELVDGEPRAMAPASMVHGLLQNELGSRLRDHLREHRADCKAIANPGVIPRLLAAHNVRVPDLGVTCAPVTPGQTTMADPVLLIEILSPSNQAETWSNVWTYTTIPSVQEILVLHSTRIAAEILRRDNGGGWPGEPEQVRLGDLVLNSIGFRVSMAELYGPTGLSG